jgi:polyhydroxybutyrate depolymerase
MHVPSSYDKTKGTMLVVAYHGFSESGLEQEVQSRMDTSSDAKGYIVAYPDGIATSWNAGDCCGDSWTGGVDDVQFTRDLLGAIEADYCIDPKRVFATGFSNGGFLSHKLGCEMSDVFGAIAPVSGVLGEDPSLCKPKRPIPVLDFHGSSDPVVPYDGGTPFINIGMGIVFRSVPDTLAFWVNENGCLAPPVTIFQNGDATCTQWSLCKGGADVVHCKIDDGGHQWPGGVALPIVGKCSTDISATDTIIDFFEAHPLP